MTEPFRILIVDDNEAIHHDFAQILASRSTELDARDALDELERMLGGAPKAPIAKAAKPATAFELVHASQGLEAVDHVIQARLTTRPFAVAFVDIRMPPGIDGIETIQRLWERQPELEVVLCSAYSDYSWDDITTRLNPGDRLVILRKPFDPIEVRQLAACLCEKWQRGRELDNRLRELEATVQTEVEARLRERAIHEEEQRRSRRLEALGTVAAGIAHEINTPTQFVASNLEYLAALVPTLAETVEPGLVDEVRHALTDARTGLERIAKIVQTVRSHARVRDRECLVATDVNDQVRAALELGRNEYKYDAEAEVELGELPPVLGDPNDLAMAILNLVVNGAHAIREKRAGNGPRGRIRVETRAVGERVEIAISDTGCGIPDALRERVFEPFFTTKPVGQGTGQGLSIARATIIERDHGTLRLDTQVGIGTTFTIGLPVHAAESSP